MSISVHVEFQYCQHGKKAILKGSEWVTVSEHTDTAVRATLRLLHPHWEAIKVLSTSTEAPAAGTPQ
jgi:hypothetical protein